MPEIDLERFRDSKGYITGTYCGHYFTLKDIEDTAYLVRIRERNHVKPPEDILVTGKPLDRIPYAYMARIPKDAPELYFFEPINKFAMYKGVRIQVFTKLNDHYNIGFTCKGNVPEDFGYAITRYDRDNWIGMVKVDDPDLKFIDE